MPVLPQSLLNRLPVVSPGSRSLRRHLLAWLLLPQLVLWAGGGLLAYRIALTYAEKAIDQSLTQSVRALARQVKPVGSGLLVDFPRAAQDVLEADPDDRVSYMVSSPPGEFLLASIGFVDALTIAVPADCAAGQNDRKRDQCRNEAKQPSPDGMPLHDYSRMRTSACERISSGMGMSSDAAVAKLMAKRFSAISIGRSPAGMPRRIWSARRAACSPMSRCTNP